MSVNLGDKVKEKVTGFTGIVVSISTHLYGCNRVGVQPPVGTDSKVPDCMWFDIDGVEVLSAAWLPATPTSRSRPALVAQHFLGRHQREAIQN